MFIEDLELLPEVCDTVMPLSLNIIRLMQIQSGPVNRDLLTEVSGIENVLLPM